MILCLELIDNAFLARLVIPHAELLPLPPAKQSAFTYIAGVCSRVRDERDRASAAPRAGDERVLATVESCCISYGITVSAAAGARVRLRCRDAWGEERVRSTWRRIPQLGSLQDHY